MSTETLPLRLPEALTSGLFDLEKPPILHSDSDEFGTPDYIYRPLDEEFHFTVDVAASAENTKCPTFIDKYQNALQVNWIEEAEDWKEPPVFWCNPPYSRKAVAAFVRKAYEESQKGATVVMLLPARTEQSWFHDIVLKHAEVRFIRKRVKFIGGETSARFPSMIAIFPKHRVGRGSIPWDTTTSVSAGRPDLSIDGPYMESRCTP